MRFSRWVKFTVVPVFAIFLLTACATFGPPGPTRPAFIGMGKTQTQFYQDDTNCRAMATARAGDPAQVQQSQAGSAILGTLFGAALGAGIGAATGGGRGAGIGAAIGGATGTAVGVGGGTAQAQADAARIQQKWDAEYHSCMYAAGHQVPGGAAPAVHQPAPPVYAPPPPPPSSPTGSYLAPPPAQAAPAPPSAPCKQTGKYVKTPTGFQPECE